jgi:integrase/recombinase XerD
MRQKEVGNTQSRKHTVHTKSRSTAQEHSMAQAATLTQAQLQRVLDYVKGCTKHSVRNRAILLTTHLSGMRIGEVAALRYGDVVAADGTIRSEVRLSATQTKGNRARVVLLPERLRAELAQYLQHFPLRSPNLPLFYTQRSPGFTADTLTHVVNAMYKNAGFDGASSHSGRRTFITNLAERGVGARVLMELAGHTNLSTTQRYIDIKPSMLRAAVELV